MTRRTRPVYRGRRSRPNGYGKGTEREAIPTARRILATLVLAHAASSIPVQTTAYCQAGVTASGQWTRPGTAAANWLKLGTRIRVWPPAWGRTLFVVLDRVGYGTSLDLWTSSCSAAWTYGRRTEHVQVLSR